MAQRRLDVVNEPFRPVYVIWELTLRCDQPCTHCGSRAGDARKDELSTDEALDVVRQLAALGAQEVVLIGGEAYLHVGCLAVVAAVRKEGMAASMVTGGRSMTWELVAALAAAGIGNVSVSIDGLAKTHDRMRAAPGSFASATATLGHLKKVGVQVSANTNLNRFNRDDLEAIYQHLRAHGVRAWQVQLTAPLGRAADRPDMMLQPWDLLDLVPRIAKLKEQAFRDGITLMPGDNLGYFGPEEALLRSLDEGATDHWHGCQAGRYVLGIESNGALKACQSLQTPHYLGGSIRERSLQDLWKSDDALAFMRTRTIDDLWGFCRTCPFADPCLAGCTFTAHALLGRAGNNPYCHFRARTFAKEAKRERLVPRQGAPGLPFDGACFELVVEPIDAPEPPPPSVRSRLLRSRGRR